MGYCLDLSMCVPMVIPQIIYHHENAFSCEVIAVFILEVVCRQPTNEFLLVLDVANLPR